MNKELLEKTIAYAETLSTEGVTDTAKAAFEKALAEAKDVMADKEATQDEVNAAWDNLLEGIWGLGLTQGDKTMLNLVIQRAEAMMDEADKYVETNWKTLVDALDAARKVQEDGDAMQEDVDEATEALLNAILAQRYKADKSILEDLLAEAENVDTTGASEAAVAAFRTALDNARAVMADATLSEDDQAKVDDAVAALSAAMDGLTAGGAPETTDKPQATEKPAEKPAQTGDSAQLMLYVAALGAAVVALSTATVVRKRRGN